MQTFSTKTVRHEFAVDDVVYYLPGVNVGDLEAISGLAGLEVEPQLVAFRELVASRVLCGRRWFWQRSPRRAVAALTVNQLSELFTAWTGIGKTVGESSASDL